MSASEPRVALMPPGCEVNSKVHLNRGATAAPTADSSSLKGAAGWISPLFSYFIIYTTKVCICGQLRLQVSTIGCRQEAGMTLLCPVFTKVVSPFSKREINQWQLSDARCQRSVLERDGPFRDFFSHPFDVQTAFGTAGLCSCERLQSTPNDEI